MSKKFYEAVIKRVQVYRCPIAADVHITADDVEAALDDWWGMSGHIENDCTFTDGDVEVLGVYESGNGLTSEEITSDSFSGYQSGGIVVFRTEGETGDGSLECATYEKENHRKYVEDETSQTAA